jgi:hypothetical protein
MKASYKTWKSLSHEDVSVNNNKSSTFFRNYKELQKEQKQNKKTNKQPNNQTGKGSYIILSDMYCYVSSYVWVSTVVVVIAW